MILWWLVFSWLAYDDYKNLSIYTMGSVVFTILTIHCGDISKWPYVVTTYLIIRLMTLIPLKQTHRALGEGDIQLLSIMHFIHDWNAWCELIWLSTFPCLCTNKKHPFYTYYFISSILHSVCKSYFFTR